MENINEVVREYMQVHAEKTAAEKREKYLKAVIEGFAAGRKFFETTEYNVILSARSRESIDTKRVYADFPEFKDVYGTTTTYNVITAAEKTDAEKDTFMAAEKQPA